MRIVGAKGRVDVENALEIAERLSRKWDCEIALFNGELVFGRDHLVSAHEHAVRAFHEKSNTCKTLSTEMILYAAGERQISKAIEKIGIRDGQEHVAIAILGDPTDDQVSELLSDLGMTRDDEVLLANDENLEKFGITKKELGTVPKEKRSRLVLEKVALLDLIK
jgi:KEOPS complex subunit Cgi121